MPISFLQCAMCYPSHVFDGPVNHAACSWTLPYCIYLVVSFFPDGFCRTCKITLHRHQTSLFGFEMISSWEHEFRIAVCHKVSGRLRANWDVFFQVFKEQIWEPCGIHPHFRWPPGRLGLLLVRATHCVFPHAKTFVFLMTMRVKESRMISTRD